MVGARPGAFGAGQQLQAPDRLVSACRPPETPIGSVGRGVDSASPTLSAGHRQTGAPGRASVRAVRCAFWRSRCPAAECNCCGGSTHPSRQAGSGWSRRTDRPPRTPPASAAEGPPSSDRHGKGKLLRIWSDLGQSNLTPCWERPCGGQGKRGSRNGRRRRFGSREGPCATRVGSTAG